MSDITVIDANDRRGASWEVGATDDQGLALTLGPAKVVLYGELRDRYAEAVAGAMALSLPPLPRAEKCPRCYLPAGTPPVPGSAAERCDHLWHRYRPHGED